MYISPQFRKKEKEKETGPADATARESRCPLQMWPEPLPVSLAGKLNDVSLLEVVAVAPAVNQHRSLLFSAALFLSPLPTGALGCFQLSLIQTTRTPASALL